MPSNEKAPLLECDNKSGAVDQEARQQYDAATGDVDATTEFVTVSAEDSIQLESSSKVEIEILTQSGSHIVCQAGDLSDENVSHQTTKMQTLMHLLKGMVGTGILAMPVAFKNGGLWVSFVILAFIGVVCVHCMHVLVLSGNELCKRTGAAHLDYGSVMGVAFETANERWRKYSQAAKRFVNAFLIITQFGFCCVYTVFVAQNIKQVVKSIAPNKLDDKIFIVFIGVLLVPYVMVKSLRALAPFSAFANMLNCVGLVIVMINLFQGLPSVDTRPAVATSISTLPLFFGQAMFAFEGIGLVLPLHNKMKEKGAFLGWAGILNLGLTMTISLYIAVGFYGYLKYGEHAMGSVTLNLPNDEWLYLSVKLMFALSLFISYGLQFYVPINIVWPFITRKMSERGTTLPNYTEHLFRVILVVMISGLAALVPHLDLLIALVGACASSFLAIIFPAIIDTVTFGPSPLRIGKNGFIVVMGLVGGIAGTYASISEIVQKF